MSTANVIPETWNLNGDDARETLVRTGRLRLLRDAFKRLRLADGFSHARSIAFLLSLLFIEGVIALVGLASVLGSGGLSDAIVRGLQTAVPGPAGRILTDAVAQAHRVGSGARYVALWAALGAAIVTGTTLLGQLERGMNRIYGVEQDRPTLRKYGNAFLLLCSAGVLGALGFLCLALGDVIGSAFNNDAAGTVWNVVRWPAGLLFITAAMVLILRRAPNRRQPGWSWLAMGAVLAVGLWVVVTVAVEALLQRQLDVRPNLRSRSPGSWLSCCGPMPRRRPCCTGCPLPPSWRPCEPACRRRKAWRRRPYSRLPSSPRSVDSSDELAQSCRDRPDHRRKDRADPPHAGGRDRRPGNRGQSPRGAPQRGRDLSLHVGCHRRRPSTPSTS